MENTNDFYHQLQMDAEFLVREAGKILAECQDNFSVVKMKDPVDLATNADIAAEKFITDFIRRKYPGHGIFAEESGSYQSDRDFIWIIDPLDGTKDYCRGLTEYNCLVAVEYKGKVVAGTMQRNGINELYSASSGNGVILNQKSITVSSQTDIAKSFVGFHVPKKTQSDEMIKRGINALENLVRHAYRVRPGWDNAKSSGLVARGAFEANVICPDVIKWYDIAPLIIIVEEAGGKVTNWQGAPITNRDLSMGMIISNTHIHDEILKYVNT
jgi:fructose-1,6-bisphosphatase/inositol monophosphatase family enzyme